MLRPRDHRVYYFFYPASGIDFFLISCPVAGRYFLLIPFPAGGNDLLLMPSGGRGHGEGGFFFSAVLFSLAFLFIFNISACSKSHEHVRDASANVSDSGKVDIGDANIKDSGARDSSIIDGEVESGPIDAGCQPTSCAMEAKNCGTIADGCDGSIDCGKCATDQSCIDNICRPNTCLTGDASVLRGDAVIDDVDTVRDIESLKGITFITGSLTIDKTDLTELYGLECLIRIDKNLTIGSKDLTNGGNMKLKSLKGLNNLVKVGGYLFVTNNDVLTTMEGLYSLTGTGDFSINYNDKLTTLNGLDKLTYINGYLSISHNNILYNIYGLRSIVKIDDVVAIFDNKSLRDIKGLNNLTNVVTLRIMDNISLLSLNGLKGLNKISQDLEISGNASLVDFSGLNSLERAGDIYVYNNSSLTSFEGLESLTTIERVLGVSGNPRLTSLKGLENVKTVSGWLQIFNNESLPWCELKELSERATTVCTCPPDPISPGFSSGCHCWPGCLCGNDDDAAVCK